LKRERGKENKCGHATVAIISNRWDSGLEEENKLQNVDHAGETHSGKKRGMREIKTRSNRRYLVT